MTKTQAAKSPSPSQVTEGSEGEVEGFLRRKFEGLVREVEMVGREDLDLVGRNVLGGGEHI